jgi:ATP-dependent RNA helicase RhlB
MIFVNTREEARRLVERLERHGYNAKGLTGSVIQRRRLSVLTDFKEGRLPILVATDVASRGLHIEGVSHVVNYDLPFDPEDYVHRVGRTARIGQKGVAFSLACDNFIYSLPAIEKLLGISIPTAFADDSLFMPVKPRPHGESSRSEPRRGGRRDGRREEYREPRRTEPAPLPPAQVAPSPETPQSDGPQPPPSESGNEPAKKRRRRRRRRGKGPGGETSATTAAVASSDTTASE